MLFIDSLSMKEFGRVLRRMAKAKHHITDAELEVLKLLWDTPDVTIRELTVSLYGEPTNSHIGTVQKLIRDWKKST